MTDFANKALIDEYLDTLLSASTKRAYRSDLKAWESLTNSDSLVSVSTDEILTATESSEFSLLAASTQKRRLAVLKSFRDWVSRKTGQKAQQIDISPCVGKRAFGRSVSPSLPLSREECNTLLHAARISSSYDSVRNYAMIYFMLSIPMRRTAMSRIDVEDLYMDSALPFVHCSKTRGDLPLRYTLTCGTVEVLNNHLSHYGIATGPLWRSHSRRNPGGRLTPTSIYRIVRETALKAGLPDIGAHTLRHTGCTLAIDNGASLQQVQTHARHKQIETTMVYVHQRDRLRDSAADFIKIDEQDDS
jgi:integrase